MYGFIALIVIVVAIGAYTQYAPSFNAVPNTVSEGMKADRVNVLLIGVGGDTHPGEGKNLADAIILASVKPSTGEVALVSVPRDLYVPLAGNSGMNRLNAAHALGDQIGYKGKGAGLLIDTVEETFGQPIHAYMRVDFAAFEKVIDALGGVDIYVHRPFHDFLFNDSFEAGWQHMNGRRALRYARYRYVRASAEGNNFGREMRQQQVIAAVRKKAEALDAGKLLQLSRLGLTASRYTSTNLTPTQMLELYRAVQKRGGDSVRNVSLKGFTDVIMLKDPALAGEAVAAPGNDYTRIRQLVAGVFETKDRIIAPADIRMTTSTPPATESRAAISP